jgi:HlyD family secretion protein
MVQPKRGAVRSWWILAGALVLAAGAWAYARLNAAVPVEAARVTRGDIREFVDEQGQTRLPKTYLITMPYDGRIAPIEVTEGTPVKAGQIVARVVPLDLELSVDEAKAAVDRLNASIRENDDTSVELTTLTQSLRFVESMDRTVEAATERVRAGQAKSDFSDKHLQRMRQLNQSKAASDEDLNQAEVSQVQSHVDYQQDLLVLSALKSMQAATALVPTVVRQYIARKALPHDVLEHEKVQAEIRLREQRRDEARGTMTSPVDGVVLDRYETNERRVASGTVLLSIGRLEDLEVEADILSQDVVNVKPGDPVDLYGPAMGPTPGKGKVRQIYPAGFTKVSSLGVEQQRVKVVVEFVPGELARLRSQQDLGVGYRVRVRVYTAEKSHTMTIPRSALFRGPAGNWQVFAVMDGRSRLVSVEVGLLNDERVEITAGLGEDAIVILAPETSLVDGTSVRPVIAALQNATPQNTPAHETPD